MTKEMHINSLEPTNNVQAKANQPSPDALRKAATQFEAVLLMQLTSSLNSTSDEGDEDSLFGNDGGSGLSKQMFSEQLATSMAQSGGIGLSDLIMKNFGGTDAKSSAIDGPKGLSNVLNTIKSLKGSDIVGETPKQSRAAMVDLIAKKGFTGDPDEAAIISTFDEQARTSGVDESLRNLEIDGKIANTTRSRIVPNVPVVEVVPANSRVSPSFEKVSYQFPVKGRLSSGFGNRFHPIDKKIKFHAGIDIAVPVGTPVAAAAQGVVTFAGHDGDYGNLVIIQHPDGRLTRYGHLSKILVSRNDQVTAGDEIALSGSTGKSTGPHVHFEVRENGQVVNPIKILSNVLPGIAER